MYNQAVMSTRVNIYYWNYKEEEKKKTIENGETRNLDFKSGCPCYHVGVFYLTELLISMLVLEQMMCICSTCLKSGIHCGHYC